MSYLGTPPNSPMVNLVGLVLGDTPAVPVVAEKVAFTSELKGFDPLPFSPEHMARASHSPSDLVGHTEDAKPRMKPPDSLIGTAPGVAGSWISLGSCEPTVSGTS